MNKLKQTSANVYLEQERTRKFQELSYITFLGYNILNFRDGIIFCLARPNEMKRYFESFPDSIKSKIFYKSGNKTYTTHSMKLIGNAKVSELESHFISVLKDMKGLDALKGLEFTKKFNKYFDDYMDSYNKQSKSKFGEDYKFSQRSLYLRLCAMQYALYVLDKNLYDKAMYHSGNEMHYYSRIFESDYLDQAREDLNNQPMATEEMDLIKDINYTLNYESRFISYKEERLADNVLIAMIEQVNIENNNLEN